MIVRYIQRRHLKPGDVILDRMTGEPQFTVRSNQKAVTRGYYVQTGTWANDRLMEVYGRNTSGRGSDDLPIHRVD